MAVQGHSFYKVYREHVEGKLQGSKFLYCGESGCLKVLLGHSMALGHCPVQNVLLNDVVKVALVLHGDGHGEGRGDNCFSALF